MDSDNYRFGTLEYFKAKFRESPKWETKNDLLSRIMQTIVKPYSDGTDIDDEALSRYVRNLMQAYNESK